MRRGLRRLDIVAALRRSDGGQAGAHVKSAGDFAGLAILDAVYPSCGLLLDDLADRGGQTSIESLLVDLPSGLARLDEGQKIGWTRQAPDMGRQDAIGAQFHAWVRLASRISNLVSTISKLIACAPDRCKPSGSDPKEQ